MQIHELNTFTGTPSSSDYLAVDDGTETLKIPVTEVGIPMSIAEAEAGTGTEPRTITPEVLNTYVSTMSMLVIEVEEFSSLSQVVSDERITADMVVANAVLTNPSGQTGDWTITTAAGHLTIAGSISGTTGLTLYLAKSR